MKKLTLLILIFLVSMGAAVPSAFAVSKETLQMMQQLDALQQALQSLQKTVDSQSAILKTLVEKSSDNVNAMKPVVSDLQNSIQQNLASTNARFDSMTTQIQALSESLDETKSRISKLSDQVTQTQNYLQTMSAMINPAPGSTTTAPGAPGTPPAPGAPPVPDADSLYTQGLSYFNGGQWDLSIQSFQDYLKYYKDTDRASNAQFYIGECYYSQGDYSHAIDAYDACIEKYPNGNKAAAAQLKKGFALLAMDQKEAGIRELRSLVQLSPGSHEADLARQKLKTLGITVPSTATHKKAS